MVWQGAGSKLDPPNRFPLQSWSPCCIRFRSVILSPVRNQEEPASTLRMFPLNGQMRIEQLLADWLLLCHRRREDGPPLAAVLRGSDVRRVAREIVYDEPAREVVYDKPAREVVDDEPDSHTDCSY